MAVPCRCRRSVVSWEQADKTCRPSCPGGDFPHGAVRPATHASLRRYLGAAPPAGHGTHYYYFVVHALDVDHLDLPDGATPAYLGFNLFSHTLARAVIVANYEQH